MADTGGPYLSWAKRVGSAALGGAAWPGHRVVWCTVKAGPRVVALVVVAGVSGVLSAVGDIGSAAGLAAAGVHLAGHRAGRGRRGRPGTRPRGSWPGWSGRRSRSCPAGCGRHKAGNSAPWPPCTTRWPRILRAVGGDQFTAWRQALTSAFNTAYDELLTARSTATGRSHGGRAWPRGAEREPPDRRGGGHARRGRDQAAAAGYRDRSPAGRCDQERDSAADDPAALGR